MNSRNARHPALIDAKTSDSIAFMEGFYSRFGKRCLDLVIAVPVFVVASPLLLVLAALVRARLGGPVLFRQERVGLGDRVFRLLKFRTMTNARDTAGRLLPDADRLTPFGHFLRRRSLDELPQLLNVLRGDLSLVGPRPLLVRYLPRYTERQRRRHAIRPGITGWAQLHGRNRLDWEAKFEHDLWYVARCGLWLDLTILWRTAWALVAGGNVATTGDDAGEFWGTVTPPPDTPHSIAADEMQRESIVPPQGSLPARELRVAFIGMNDPTSARHLELLAAAYPLAAVFESTRQRGWRRLLFQMRSSRLRRLARRRAVPYRLIGPAERNRIADLLRESRADIVCVVTMAQLLPPAALAVPTLGIVNLHPSLLPAYRGVDPLFWQLYDDVTESGVTVHLVDDKEDHGPILGQRRFPLPIDITDRAFEDLIGEHGPPLLLEAIEILRVKGAANLAPQPDSPTRRARRVSRNEARELIDWHRWSIERVWRFLRAAGPRIDLPPTCWRDLGWRWPMQSFEKVPTSAPPGSLQRDVSGWYYAHPEGRIRLGRTFAPVTWLALLLRRQFFG